MTTRFSARATRLLPTTTRGHALPLLLGLATLLIAAPAHADPPASRVLAREDIAVYGLGLKVEPARQVVPRDIATIVSVFLQAPSDPGVVPPFAESAEVRATLRGPSLTGPLDLVTRPNMPFQIPALKIAGVHTLENIRLVSGGEVLLYGSPEQVEIEVIDKLLVTQITARPLTAEEIRERGIVFDRSNFQAYNFTAAFAVADGPAIPITFPVVLPTLAGPNDVRDPTATLGSISTQAQLRDLTTIIPDTLRIQTQVPNLRVVGFTLQAPRTPQGQQLVVPPIPGVIVIPGDIGFLNQFFSVMLMVGNVAPAGSNLVVRDLSATLLLPAGNDEVAGTPDDPLAMARTATGETARIKAVTQPGADGVLGTADDLVTIGPGETGNAEFLVEGRREGSHAVEMAIDATLLGLPVGPVPIQGRAAGMVTVRNPRFTLTFTHPDIVNAGEAYTLDVTVTNTSDSPANFVSLNLYPRNISGARLVGDATQDIEFIAPQDSATVSFRLISALTGKVTAATLDGDGNVAGRFAFKTAVGELGVPLSAESLVLPSEASALPRELREAALGLLGRAWALATAPPAAVPKDLTRFSKQLVIDRAIDLAEAGLRVSLGEPLADAVGTLWFDFAGSDFARIGETLQLPREAPLKAIIERDYEGFDLLRRRSVRGDVLAAAFASVLATRLAEAGPVAFHQGLAEQATARAPHVSVLVAGQNGGATPVDLVLVDPDGAALGGPERADKIAKRIPFGEIATLANSGGLVAAHLATIVTPRADEYVVRLTRRPDASPAARYTLSLVVPSATGLRRIVFENVALGEVPAVAFAGGDPVRLRIERVDGETPVGGSSRAPSADAAVADPPPAVLGVKQLASADLVGCGGDGAKVPAGRVVAVLFSEEVTRESVQDRRPAGDITAFLPEANRAVSVALQPSRRVAYVAMRDPFGPFVPRTMTVVGVSDRAGQVLATQTIEMQATVGEQAGVLSGRVLSAEGRPVADAPVRMLYEFVCSNGVGTVGISEQLSDANGRFAWDYVPMGPTVKLIAFDPETDLPSTVRFAVGRAAQRLNVDVVFVGRGTVRGRTLDESGAPLGGTTVRVTSLSDNSQYGATTDAAGRFLIPRVPVGNVLIEAVNTTARAQTAVSDLVAFAGATLSRDLTLFAAGRTPEGVTIRYGTATGRVLRDLSLEAASGVTVYAYYQDNSQDGVRCPRAGAGRPLECAVAAAVSDDGGGFGFEQLPAGEYRVVAIDQGALSEGVARLTLPAGGTRSVNVVLSGGLGQVRGTVVDATGAGVAGAIVGGGLSLVTTDGQGGFLLPDVPLGQRTIVAVSEALGARGSATIDVTRPGEVVDVRIVMPSTASITGVVRAPDGVTPVEGITVYAFRPLGRGGIEVGGEAVTGSNGGYRLDRLALDSWTLSAFRPDFSEGNFAKVTLRYHGESLRQDIRFRGAGGRVRGTVSAADGVTRLAARVGISGDRLLIGGGRVAIRFEYVQNFQIVDTNPRTGEFAFSGLFVGPFTLRALGQFSPDPITVESQIATPNQEVRVDLRLQPTSVITGVLYLPDGATPAPANVQVKFKSNAVKVFCTESLLDEPSCTSVPQGIQEEIVVTNDRGEFVFPLVNAGPFTLTADEAATGRTAELRGTVRAGERLGVTMRLVGLGTIAVAVKASDATTPIPGARVDVRQSRFPFKSQTLTAGPDGLVSFPNYSEGEFVVSALDMRNGAQGRASGAITTDGQTVAVNVFLFDQQGSVEGTVRRADGSPAPNTQVVISRNGSLVGFALTDAEGAFAETGIPLGAIAIEAFEPTTGARGRFTGSLDLNGQALAANFRLDALGLLRGTLVEARTLSPLKNWQVWLSQTTPSGRSLSSLITTTGVDGSFSFPGASVGTFQLSASSPGVVGQASASGAIARAGQLVEITLLATINRAVFGRVSGIVTQANGQPSTTAVVTLRASTGVVHSTSVQEDGRFAFDNVPLGRFTVDAVAQGTGGAGRAVSELLFEDEDAQVVIALGGVATLGGRVFASDGVTPVQGAQVTLSGSPALGCNPCTVGSGPDGAFTFANTPVRVFTITAEDPLTGLKGSVSDVITGGQSRGDLRVVLQPTSSISGRVLTGGGAPASGIVAELRSGGRTLFVETAADGTFAFGAVPLGAFTLSLQDPIGPGLARRTGTLATPVSFGDIVLDETPPAVVSVTPGAGAIGVARDVTVRFVFSEQVDLGTVNPTTVTLSSAAGAVTGILSPEPDERTFTFDPVSDLSAETRYTLRVDGVRDRMGRAMATPFSATFTTVDITPPSITELTPPAGATGVTSFTTIRVKFSEPIDPSRYAGAPIVLRQGAAVLDGTIAYLFGNTVVVFTPARPLADETAYQVQLAQTFDPAGNALPAQSFAFQTTDRTPPVILSLTPIDGDTVIEGTVKQIAANLGSADVAVVDYYVNDVPIAAVRTVPFTFAFNALPQFGAPGARVKISALATDTSGNRATTFATTFVTVTPDQPPTVQIMAPVAGASVPNGQRVNVSVRATDDVGVAEVAYRAGTGSAADAAVRTVTPAATVRVEAFGFDVPASAAPGSTITIEATARDSKGQVVAAAPVSISVLDAVAPTVTITGASSGERVRPGQVVTAIVVAEDAGRIREIGFTASGVASLNQVRAIVPALASVATSFTFTVAQFAGPSDRVLLDAYAIDVAGNRREAGRVILSIADNVPPAVTLRTSSGRSDMTPGRQVVVVAEANDETGVSRITLTGRGAFTVSDAKSISPPLTSVSANFTIDVPASVPDGATLQLEARAIDLSGNVSSPGTLTLTARPLSDVTLPLSTVLLAGERRTLTLSLGSPAPAGGLRVDLAASNGNVIVTPFVLFAAGETERTFDLDGVSGGTSAISASIAGVERATMTATVQGGVVRGRVVSAAFEPVGGAQVTVVGGNTLTTTTEADGTFLVQGIIGFGVTVRVLDPVTSRIGFAQAWLNAANGFVTLADIVVIAGGTFTGVVERPAPPGTRAGAGVQVQLFRRSGSSVGELLATTFTDAQSSFTFALVGLGDYFIDAFEASTGNRGRAATAIPASGAEVPVTVTFLGRGRVEGTVRTAGGTPVDNATVGLQASSDVGSSPQRTATTAGGGRYAFDDVLVGNVTVTATDPVSNTSGSASGQITADGQTVTLDVSLQAVGSIAGQVTRFGGTPVGPGISVSLQFTGRSTVTDDAGRYRFDFVPVGTYTVLATENSTNSRGSKTATVAANGTNVTADVTFLGKGTVVATVRDANAQPVAGASVTISQPRGDSLTGTTDVNGQAVFNQVNEGSYSVTATANGLSGTAGPIVVTPNQQSSVTVTLEATATITATVFLPNGSTPATAGSVSLRRFGFPLRSVTLTPELGGQFSFEGIPLGTYEMWAYDGTSRLRALSRNITLTSNGQQESRTLTFVGLGTVTGTVSDPPPGGGAASVQVTVQSLTPDFGGSYSATTNAAGGYSVANVPVGDVIVTASNAAQQLLGEGTGRITTDGQSITVDVVLQSSAVSLPLATPLSDAYARSYRMQRDGSVKGGHGDVFGNEFSTGAMELEIVRDGTATRFTGSQVGVYEDGRREIAVTQNGIAGINVTRKLYVPANGYFGRWVELLSNPSSEPITVDVRVSAQLRGFFGLRTVASSSGDTTLDAGDLWAVIDDGNTADPYVTFNFPPIAFVMGGPGAAVGVGSASLTTSNNLVTYEWRQVTVPAGGRVALMHFVAQQTSTAAGVASGERLSGLAPEALGALSATEAQQTVNFTVPADLSSPIEPLPPFGGSIAGLVYEGDGTTRTPGGTLVRFKSDVAVFSREIVQSSNPPTSAFSIAEFEGRPIPLAPGSLWAVHPDSGVVSGTVPVTLSPQAPSATQNVVFTGTAIVEVRTERPDGSRVPGGQITVGNLQLSTTLPGGAAFSKVKFLGTQGVTEFYGVPMPAASNPYVFQSGAQHSQGSGFIASGSLANPVANSRNVTTLLFDGASIRGRVLLPSGAPAVGLTVRLTNAGNLGQDGSFERRAVTDANGDYVSTDVRAEAITVAVTIAGQTYASSRFFAAPGQTYTVDFNFNGSLTVNTRRANGGVVGGTVYLVRPGGTVSSQAIPVAGPDAGTVIFTGLPVGTYTVYADALSLQTLRTPGQDVAVSGAVSVDLVFPPFGSVRGTVTRPSGAPVAGAQLTTSASPAYSRSATTPADGRYEFADAPIGRLISVRMRSGVTDRTLQATLAADGDVATLDFATIAQASVRFTVRASDGTPLSGVTASAARFALPTLTATTDASGTAFLGPFAENEFLTLTLRDPQNRFAPVTRYRQIRAAEDGTAIPFDWVVGLSGTIRGQVVDADGVPLGGARVDHVDGLSGVVLRSVFADANGQFSFDDIAAVLAEATASVVVRAVPDLGFGSFLEVLAGTERRTFTAAGQVLDGPVAAPVLRGSVSGVVTAAGGGLAGLAPYVVALLPDGSYYGVALVDPATGAFASSATTLLPAGPFRLAAVVNGLALDAVQQTVTLERPANTAVVAFEVPGVRVQVTGRVFADAAMTIPAPGVYPLVLVPQTVNGRRQEWQGRAWGTDADGRFVATVLVPEAEVRVRLLRPDDSVVQEFIESVAGPSSIDLGDVSLGVSVVRVTVRDVVGQAIPPSTITLTDSGGDVRSPNAFENDGTAVFLQVPAGAFSVRATVTGLGAIAGAGMLSTPTEVLELSLQYQQAGVTGTVVPADGVTPITGRTFTVAATNLSSGGSATAVVVGDNRFSLEETFASAGDTIVVAVADEDGRPLGRVERTLQTTFDVVDVPVSVVKGVVALDEGGQPSPGATVELTIGFNDPDTGDYDSAFYSTTADDQGRYAFAGVPCGDVSVTATASDTRTKYGTLACPASTLVLDFIDTSLEGVVRYADGTRVPFPSVYVEQTNESGGTDYYYPVSVGDDGTYRITGVAPGPFTLYASTSTGLWTAVEGTMSGAAATLDVTLPDDMTVVGTVSRADGTPVAGASVSLVLPSVVLSTTTDANGAYAIARLPLVNFSVWGRDPQSGLLGSATGVAGSPSGTVVANVVLPQPATLGGVVFLPGGGAAAGASVSVSVPMAGSPFGRYTATAVADAAGQYTLAVQPGTAQVTASRGETATRRSIDVVDGGAATLDLTLGDYVVLPRTVTIGGGVTYQVSICGLAVTGGTPPGMSPAFTSVGRSYYYGSALLCDDVARVEDLGGGDLQYVVERTQPGFGFTTWTRKLFVPAGGSFLRYLDTFTVSPGASIPGFATDGWFNGSDTFELNAPSPGTATSEFQPWYVTTPPVSSGRPATGLVFAGAGYVPPPQYSFFSNTYFAVYFPTFSLPPSATTGSLLQFLTVQPTGSAAQGVVDSLYNLADPLALKGLTQQERASILNFTIP